MYDRKNWFLWILPPGTKVLMQFSSTSKLSSTDTTAIQTIWKKKKVWYLRGVTYLPISLTSWEAFLIENWIESSSLTIWFICSIWKYDWSERNNPKPRTESHSYRISSTSQDQSLYLCPSTYARHILKKIAHFNNFLFQKQSPEHGISPCLIQCLQRENPNEKKSQIFI